MEIKIARIKKGMTQTQLSKIIGIGRSTLVKIENGDIDNIKLGLIKKISQVLDISTQELFKIINL